MQQFVARMARLFSASALAVLLAAGPARAGQLQWQALPDRERVTVTMAPNEGLAGPVGRIAPNGVLVPFSEVPSGLNVADAPAGSRIFKGTKQQGRALVFLTQTPEFGYMVSKQTSTELVVDFFPNPLGARWKPSDKAPTTELPPDFAVAPSAPPDETNQRLSVDPQNTGQVVAPTPARPALASPYADGGGAAAPQPDPASAQAQPQPPAQTQPPVQAQPPAQPQPVAQAQPATQAPAPAQTQAQPPAQSPSPAVEPAPAPGQDDIPALTRHAAQYAAPVEPVGPVRAPDQPRPVAVVLPGTPEHATAATRFASPPNAEPSLPDFSAPSGQPGAAQSGPAANPSGIDRDTPQYTAPASGAPPAPDAARPFLNSRTQTDGRSAPLPVPAAAPSPPVGTASAQSGPVQTGVVQTAPTTPPAQNAPAQPAATPVVPASPQPTAQAAQQQPTVPAQTADSPIPPGVGARTEGLVYGGTVNTGGLNDIPPLTPNAQPPVQAQPGQAGTPPAARQEGQTTSAPVAAGGNAQDHGAARQVPPSPEAHGGAAPGTGNATVVYVDKDGKPVPPPPEPGVLLPEIRRHIAANEFAPALEKAEQLLNHANLDQLQREELLHVRAEMLFAMSKDNLAERYKDISDATVQAINYNQKSRRNAGALLRLGYMNLKLQNIPEAEARFNMLRRQYPDDENVPLTYYYWGDYHFQRDELQRAADEFQYLLQHYPNSRYAREGALGLARSFYRLGYYQQSFNVVDYIERRWERFYIEYPPFLNMMGDVAFRLNNFDYALKHYWLYVNLEPKGDEADIILTRIGDIYSMQGEKKAGKELYNESVRRFPDKDGALVAMMRLSENSVNDDPSIAGMFSVFDGPFSMAPVEVYRTIIQKHPQSALVPLAEIKLAMWHLWKREFIEALDTTAAFLQKYPDHELAPKAKELALQTFAILSAESLNEGRYGRMREIWERYPIVHGQEEILSPESRIALGVSYWKDGKPDDALKTVEPFFLGRKVPEYSEMALSLVLSIYLEHDQWRSIREVAKRVELWELSPESQQQLDYSLALAAENLDESETAAPIWQKLYESGTLPPSQQAYAAFFLARDAERERELEKAYSLGKEALNMLLNQSERNPNAADLGKIRTQLSSLMDVAETAGRLREALGFAEQYLQYLPAQDTERTAVQYRMARIYRKQGNLDAWKTTLTDIATKNPGTVYGQLASSELKAAAIAEDAARYSPTGRI